MQKYLLDGFFNKLKSDAFEVSYWDKEVRRYGQAEPAFSLVFHEKIPLAKLLKHPVMAFCEAYMDGIIDIDGDFEQIIKVASSNQILFKSKSSTFAARKASISKQKKEVQHHYDLGNEFYSLWLDETMSYSCAYFQKPEDTLDQAQLQKIDHTLRKLQLQPEEKLLDIGCGWGWMIIRAAQQYGVRATGITLSEEQHKKAQERILQLNLQKKVTVKLIDYRELSKETEKFDKIVSVGMFEHVGQAQYPVYMQAVQNLLKEQGLALLHTITGAIEKPINPWTDKYIFPGGRIPSLREIITLLPNYGFHAVDIESLRIHYAMTLDHWSERFESKAAVVKEMYGERFVRMWRLYLRTSAASFRQGGLNLHQILFTKGFNNTLALTREHLYSNQT
jgi:cyclopropane-fatty-acyl-phospholipid synthase